MSISRVEAATVAAVGLVLLAVTMPQAVKHKGTSESVALRTQLAALARSVESYRRSVGSYPDSLSYLVQRPDQPTDACGNPLPRARLSNWRGPYLKHAIAGTRADILRREVPDVPGNFGVLIVEIDNIARNVASGVELGFDGDVPDVQRGSVRWTHTLNGFGTLELHIPIKGC